MLTLIVAFFVGGAAGNVAVNITHKHDVKKVEKVLEKASCVKQKNGIWKCDKDPFGK